MKTEYALKQELPNKYRTEPLFYLRKDRTCGYKINFLDKNKEDNKYLKIMDLIIFYIVKCQMKTEYVLKKELPNKYRI
jgi:hypothetical protein